MIELIARTFGMCFLMEIGSASSFTLAALAGASPKWFIILVSGVLGIFVADLLVVKLGSYLMKLPISSNVISGVIMLVMGFYFLFQKNG